MSDIELGVKQVIEQLCQTNLLPSQEFITNIDENVLKEILDFYIFTKCAKTPKRVAYFLELITESLENNKKVLIFGISYLKTHIDLRNKTARRNVMILLAILIDKINLHADIDGKLEITNHESTEEEKLLMNDVMSKISERLFDFDRVVRNCAVQITSSFQNFAITEKIIIKRIFEDMIRHDPSADVRNNLMKYLTNENCVIDKIQDENVTVRQNFYRICLPHKKLKNLKSSQRDLIPEKSISEREFNAFPLLKSKIYEDYDLPAEIEDFVRDFFILNTVEYDRMYYERVEENRKNINLVLTEIFKDLSLKIEFFDASFYENLNLNSSLVLHAYFTYSENLDGRDCLKLVDLEYFTEILYMKIKKIAKEKFDTRDLYFIIILFQLTSFYDICDANTSKIILSMVYKFFQIEISQNDEIYDKLIENGIILASGTDRIIFTNFLGSLITKNKKNTNFLHRICKYVLIRVKPFETLHDAIIDELIIPHLDGSEMKKMQIEILFYFVIERFRENPECLSLNEEKELNSKNISALIVYLLENASDDIEILADLHMFIPSIRELTEEKIIEFYEKNKSNKNGIQIIKALSKCLLLDPMRFGFMFKYMYNAYFESENDFIKQYLTIFLQEFTLKNPTISISQIKLILPFLTTLKDQRCFMDQIISWIKSVDETQNKCLSETILLSSLIYFIIGVNWCIEAEKMNTTHDKKNISDNINSHIDLFEFIIARIPVNGTFSSSKIKQMIYCLGKIAKMGHSIQKTIEFGGLSNQLMVYNDNVAITEEERMEIEQMISDESQ